jgi:hypothetical protein
MAYFVSQGLWPYLGATNHHPVYQNLAREAVMRHLELEKAAGKEIYPAFAGLSMMDDGGNEAEKGRAPCLGIKVDANNRSLSATGMRG